MTFLITQRRLLSELREEITVGMRKNRHGQVTGQVQKRGSSKLDTGEPTIISSRSYDLAKTKSEISYELFNYFYRN